MEHGRLSVSCFCYLNNSSPSFTLVSLFSPRCHRLDQHSYTVTTVSADYQSPNHLISPGDVADEEDETAAPCLCHVPTRGYTRLERQIRGIGGSGTSLLTVGYLLYQTSFQLVHLHPTQPQWPTRTTTRPLNAPAARPLLDRPSRTSSGPDDHPCPVLTMGKARQANSPVRLLQPLPRHSNVVFR